MLFYFLLQLGAQKDGAEAAVYTPPTWIGHGMSPCLLPDDEAYATRVCLDSETMSTRPIS
jgi:hypothetical protein